MALDSDAPKQAQPETLTENDSTRENNIKPQGPLYSESHIPPPIETSGKTQQAYTLEQKRFFVEIATLIAVIVYAWLTYSIWEEMRSTGKQTDKLIEQAIKQAKAASDSADISKQHAENAGKLAESAVRQADASIAGIRPWITTTKWDYLGMKESRYIFAVVFKNVGKTPALDAITNWEFTFVPAQNRKPDYSNCPTNKKLEFRPGNISAEGSWRMEFQSDPLTDAQLKMLENKTAKLYINGCTTYRDIIANQIRVTQAAGFFPSNIGPGVQVYDAYAKMN
jgi:hypothetical protein